MKKILAGLAFGVFGIVGVASATPIAGSVMQLQNLYQGSVYPGSTETFTVDSSPGTVEISAWLGRISVDVQDAGANAFTVTLTQVAAGNGSFGPSPNIANFSSVTAGVPQYTGITLGAASADWNAPDRVSFTGSTFGFDFGSLYFAPGDFVRLDITTETAPVPEPSTMLLFGTGIAGLAVVGKRKKA